MLHLLNDNHAHMTYKQHALYPPPGRYWSMTMRCHGTEDDEAGQNINLCHQ